MLALPFVAMVVGLLLGVPIAFSLAGAGILGIYMITGNAKMILVALGTTPFSTVADYSLTTVPMFILMAYFSASSGLAKDLFTAAANWLSHIRGGLGVATVFACGVFGAMSGRKHRRCLGHVDHRLPGDAPPRLFGGTGSRHGGDRRDPGHPHPAERGHGDLRHRNPDLHRQAADRRRCPGNRRRHLPGPGHLRLGSA